MKKKLLFSMLLVVMLAFSLPVSAQDEDPGSGRLETRADSTFYESPVATSSSSDVILSYDTYQSPLTGLTYTLRQSGNVVNGIDVSYYNGNVNWEEVKAAGIDFVIIRCGYRGYGAEGNIAQDVKFESNIQGALAAGLNVGVYMFSQAITEEEAVEEAEYMLNLVDGYEVTLPLVMDYEYAPTGSSGRLYNADLSKSEATAICNAFIERIASAGYTPMIYANKSMLTNDIDGEALAENAMIWLANYTTDTTYGGPYQFWQYTESGSVDGISGNVDGNFYFDNGGVFMPFRDVAVGSWFYDDIAYVYQNDIMDGVSGTTFAPDNTTSRGMMATVLYRLSQDQAPVFEEIFTDVHANQWFANGIIWAYQKNVVNGYDDGNFGPDDDVTREQFAAMLYRYAQSRQYDTSASADLGRFGDAGQVSDYARNAMAWAVAEGYINGLPGDILSPKGTATRAQCATILARFMQDHS